jgi:hypothetical protein
MFIFILLNFGLIYNPNTRIELNAPPDEAPSHNQWPYNQLAIRFVPNYLQDQENN